MILIKCNFRSVSNIAMLNLNHFGWVFLVLDVLIYDVSGLAWKKIRRAYNKFSELLNVESAFTTAEPIGSIKDTAVSHLPRATYDDCSQTVVFEDSPVFGYVN